MSESKVPNLLSISPPPTPWPQAAGKMDYNSIYFVGLFLCVFIFIHVLHLEINSVL